MKSGESKGGKSVFGTHNPLLIWSVTEQNFINANILLFDLLVSKRFKTFLKILLQKIFSKHYISF